MHDWAAKIRRVLQDGLPGAQEQYQMAPAGRAGPEATLNPPANAKLAAVLILLYPHEGRVFFPMMKRPADSGPHSGQISFPGGAYEPGDANLEETALRESDEELGIKAEHVEVIGVLSKLYVPPSGFLVEPYVAISHLRPDFRPDPVEVDRVLEFVVDDALKHESRRRERRSFRGQEIDVPFFGFGQEKVWGASAMMLSEFVAVLSRD